MLFRYLKRTAGLAIGVAVFHAGAAMASPSASSFAAQAAPKLTLPLGFLNVTASGPGLNVDANLFPKAPYTPVAEVSLLGGGVNVNAFIGTPAVPEPESIAMLGVGLALVGYAVRRRRAANSL